MPPLPLYEDEKVIETDPDQSQFTRRITEKAVSFIRRHEEKPFFLYVPHVMPHVPIFASERFAGKSPHGLYADVVEELDWSVGLILAAVQQAGIADNTLILFFSDNGPFLSYGNHAGSAAPLREGKLTSYEGGVSPISTRSGSASFFSRSTTSGCCALISLVSPMSSCRLYSASSCCTTL